MWGLGFRGLAMAGEKRALGFVGFPCHRSYSWAHTPYRGTSLIRNPAPPGPYGRAVTRVLWWSQGEGVFL